MVGLIALGIRWMPRAVPGEAVAMMRLDVTAGGTVALGDSALMVPVSLPRAPVASATIAVDLPPRPIPGQLRPDASGRCPRRSQVAIHGGCWMKLAVDLKECDGDDYTYKGGCYAPAFPPSRPALSNPTEKHADR